MTPDIEQSLGLSEPQAARVLNVSSRTLRRWRKAGAIGHSLTPGGRVFYSSEDLRRLRTAMQVGPLLGRPTN